MMVKTETIALYIAQHFTAFYRFLSPQKSSEAVPIIFSVLNVSKLSLKRSGNATEFGDRVFKEVILLKWSH